MKTKEWGWGENRKERRREGGMEKEKRKRGKEERKEQSGQYFAGLNSGQKCFKQEIKETL